MNKSNAKTTLPLFPRDNMRRRENTDLLNMILLHLRSENASLEFKNPFSVCGKTERTYLRHAEVLSRLGVETVHKYDSKAAQLIAIELNSIPRNLVPHQKIYIQTDSDWSCLLCKICDIKSALKHIEMDTHDKINFRTKPLSLSAIIYAVGAILSIHKNTNKDDPLMNFLLGNCDAEMVIQLTIYQQDVNVEKKIQKEAALNRCHLLAIKALIFSILKIQLSLKSGFDNLHKIDVRDPFWIDSLVSSVLAVCTDI